MSLKTQLLNFFQLNSGKYISGQDLANTFNVSRTAIWKNINTLKKEGAIIESTTNRGYIYLGMDQLSKEAVMDYLELKIDFNHIEVLDSIDSSNRYLKELAVNNPIENGLIITNRQTAARGRYNREFIANNQGKGVYYSFSFTPNRIISEIPNFTTIAAVALAETIDELTNIEPDIKWVNDLYYKNKKISGILTEALTDFESKNISKVIVGIGLNIYFPDKEVPDTLKNKIGSLFSEPNQLLDRNLLVSKMINRFFKYLNDNSSKYLKYYYEHNYLLHKQISFTYKSQELSGLVTGINELGELLVETQSGKLCLNAGEVNLIQH